MSEHTDAEKLAALEAHINSIDFHNAPMDPSYMILPDPVWGEDHLRRIVDAEGDTLCVCESAEVAAALCAYLNRAMQTVDEVLATALRRAQESKP